ncbi:hypothetical protein ANANG_G00018360 [Anguilla anguilla]|uniref:Uncharacterized protein n=1 Tax=Anguilla anguilla TaxID=7936 RepID=A0A9D3N1W0_ANGAN|nr:hypothetical protein ANANG_G00018360 [Anguilla anguilla]
MSLKMADLNKFPAEARGERSPEPSERGHQRRRRKRRRHGAAGGGGGGGGGGGAEEESEPGGAREEEAGTAGGDAKTSRNRRRKEKKRRRKERLTSLGLAPGAAAAVEFTYQPGPAGEEEAEEEEEGGEEEQERGEEKMAELLDFLRATREICLSDRGASAAAQVPDAVMEGLAAGLAAGMAPPADRAGLRASWPWCCGGTRRAWRGPWRSSAAARTCPPRRRPPSAPCSAIG